jgi:hypothetical protein
MRNPAMMAPARRSASSVNPDAGSDPARID